MSVILTPLTGAFGVEATGVDLAGDISDADAEAMRDALRDRLVMVIRDQKMSPAQYVESMKVFGVPMRQHLSKLLMPDHPDARAETRLGRRVAGAVEESEAQARTEVLRIGVLEVGVDGPARGGDGEAHALGVVLVGPVGDDVMAGRGDEDVRTRAACHHVVAPPAIEKIASGRNIRPSWLDGALRAAGLLQDEETL